jgi:ribosome-binding factor A
MISPEERMGVDNVISVMVTVADVEVSNDLQVVKVFVSILGDERGKKNALNGLKKLEGYVRRNIGKRVSLRLTPEIRLVYDDSFERGQRVSSLLDVLRVERDGSDAAGNVAPGKYSKNELLALEDTITNPYEDDEDGDFAMGEDDEEEDDEEEEGGDGDEDMDDMDVEQMWEEMQKDAGSKSKGDDDLINVQ